MKTLGKIWTAAVSFPAWILIGMARVYQYTLSPLVGHWCKFQPTCSNYFILSVRKYGALSGALRGLWRICRCNPFCKGGFDPP
jgi:putative membrane protein insertion efficiency factor